MSKWCWCLIDDTGAFLKGWQQVDGNWYYLNGNGTMATGWNNIENAWYYLNPVSGEMKMGWLLDKNKWYYLIKETDKDKAEYKGQMVCNCSRVIDGKTYTFDKDGHMMESLVSDKLIDFIKSWEGFSATPYDDEVGVKTLGYGMTGSEIEGITEVTEELATQMLKDLINKKYAPVLKADLEAKEITLKQNEFDALVSMAYNVGISGVLGSTLYKNVAVGIKGASAIKANFQAWSNAGGKRLEGLYRRRTKEANMFLNADYTGNVA